MRLPIPVHERQGYPKSAARRARLEAAVLAGAVLVALCHQLVAMLYNG